MNYRVEVERDVRRLQENLYLVANDKFGRKVYVASPIDWGEIEPGLSSEGIGPTESLAPEELDALLAAFAEKAWERGWRPKGEQKPDTSAQAKHLDDMRRLVSKTLGVDLPA